MFPIGHLIGPIGFPWPTRWISLDTLGPPIGTPWGPVGLHCDPFGHLSDPIQPLGAPILPIGFYWARSGIRLGSIGLFWV